MHQLEANPKQRRRRTARWYLLVSVVVVLVCVHRHWLMVASAHQEAMTIKPNFSAQHAIVPSSRLELHLRRSLLPGEGHLAIFIGEMDVTALCVKDDNGLTYKPGAVPLPLGETSVIVYLVFEKNEWTEVARLPLLVEEPKPAAPETKENSSDTPGSASNIPTDPATRKQGGVNPFQFIPSVSVRTSGNLVGES